jgi:hypothetical protein
MAGSGLTALAVAENNCILTVHKAAFKPAIVDNLPEAFSLDLQGDEALSLASEPCANISSYARRTSSSTAGLGEYSQVTVSLAFRFLAGSGCIGSP